MVAGSGAAMLIQLLKSTATLRHTNPRIDRVSYSPEFYGVGDIVICGSNRQLSSFRDHFSPYEGLFQQTLESSTGFRSTYYIRR